jgi:hypothetical protein
MTDHTLSRTHGLPAGPRVRLRLARPSDHQVVRALLLSTGVEASDFQVSRLLGFDPARRLVLAAVAPVDGTETLVGIGAIDLERHADVDTLVVDTHLTDGLAPVLRTALLRRARGSRPRLHAA